MNMQDALGLYADKLRRAVRRDGRTQAELSEIVGSYPSHFSEWMHGGSMPIERMDELAETLGVFVDCEVVVPGEDG